MPQTKERHAEYMRNRREQERTKSLIDREQTLLRAFITENNMAANEDVAYWLSEYAQYRLSKQ